jgi:CRP/FNR family transcriptional regulator, cyclic AMP receptor protein
MATDPVAGTIRSVLCPRLSPAETAQLLDAMLSRAVPPGHPICREGDEAVGLLLLLSGTAEVLRGKGERLATVEAPTVLGEMSLLTNGRHTATVRAQTECELRLLPKAEFVRLVEADSPAAYKLLATVAEVLARRLSRMDDKVVELTAQHRPIEELAAFRQKLFTEWTF